MSEPEVTNDKLQIDAVYQDRVLNAKGIINSSARLLKLVQLNAPEIVIEHEKRLIIKRLNKIVISADAVARADEHDILCDRIAHEQVQKEEATK